MRKGTRPCGGRRGTCSLRGGRSGRLVGRGGTSAHGRAWGSVKSPSSTLVLDAAVLVAAARGRSSGAVLAAAGAAVLVTADRVVQESRRRIELVCRARRAGCVAVAAEGVVASVGGEDRRGRAALQCELRPRRGAGQGRPRAGIGLERRGGRLTMDRDLPEQAPPLVHAELMGVPKLQGGVPTTAAAARGTVDRPRRRISTHSSR